MRPDGPRPPIAGPDTGIFLYENSMLTRDEHLRAGWKQADALLLLFDFFGNTDCHVVQAEP